MFLNFTDFHDLISRHESMSINWSNIINSSSIVFIFETDRNQDTKNSFSIKMFWNFEFLNFKKPVNGHIVNIIIKYIEFHFIQSFNLKNIAHVLFELIVQWICWEPLTKMFCPTDFRLSPSLSRNSIKFTSISILGGPKSISGTTKCLWGRTNYYTDEK